MDASHSTRPSAPGVALSAVFGLLVGFGLAFPEVSRQALVLLEAVDGLGASALVVVVGSLGFVPLAIGLFVLWRIINGAP